MADMRYRISERGELVRKRGKKSEGEEEARGMNMLGKKRRKRVVRGESEVREGEDVTKPVFTPEKKLIRQRLLRCRAMCRSHGKECASAVDVNNKINVPP